MEVLNRSVALASLCFTTLFLSRPRFGVLRTQEIYLDRE